jgi:phosphate transport system permease protein
MTRHYARRKAVNFVMFGATAACALVALATLFFILGYLVYHGAASLNRAFFTRLPAPPGETGGGMANAILGSLELIGVAALIGAPIGLLAGAYVAEYGGASMSFAVRYATDLLNGVPSIVIGIFAYALVVVPMRHFSLLAGGVALSVIFMPVAVRTTEQFLRAVPQPLREGSLALGASKWRSIATVVIPAASRGIATGLILAVARIAGETAPLLFTAFGNRYWSASLGQPVASLPVMIFTYAISPYDEWRRQAWAAGLVLLALILGINIIARAILAPKHG